MAQQPEQPSVEEILNDPKHTQAKDRAFSMMDAWYKDRATKAKESKKAGAVDIMDIFNPASIFGAE